MGSGGIRAGGLGAQIPGLSSSSGKGMASRGIDQGSGVWGGYSGGTGNLDAWVLSNSGRGVGSGEVRAGRAESPDTSLTTFSSLPLQIQPLA